MVLKIAVLTAVRLREQRVWINVSSGHSTILNDLGFVPNITDYCVPIVEPDKPFYSTIPSREDWSDVDVWQPSHLNFSQMARN